MSPHPPFVLSSTKEAPSPTDKLPLISASSGSFHTPSATGRGTGPGPSIFWGHSTGSRVGVRVSPGWSLLRAVQVPLRGGASARVPACLRGAGPPVGTTCVRARGGCVEPRGPRAGRVSRAAVHGAARVSARRPWPSPRPGRPRPAPPPRARGGRCGRRDVSRSPHTRPDRGRPGYKWLDSRFDSGGAPARPRHARPKPLAALHLPLAPT